MALCLWALSTPTVAVRADVAEMRGTDTYLQPRSLVPSHKNDVSTGKTFLVSLNVHVPNLLFDFPKIAPDRGVQRALGGIPFLRVVTRQEPDQLCMENVPGKIPRAVCGYGGSGGAVTQFWEYRGREIFLVTPLAHPSISSPFPLTRGCLHPTGPPFLVLNKRPAFSAPRTA